MKPTISIIIATFHRKTSLLRLLGSLVGEIDRKTSEIIVAEQGDNNGKTYKEFAKTHNTQLTYVFLKERSTAHAMNIGVGNAKGEFIVFLDDDVTVHKGFIKHHVTNFIGQLVAATVGRIVTDGQPTEPKRRDTGRINWIGSFSDGFSSAVKQEVDTVIGANMCWRKGLYKKLGGMDEQFAGNALRLESDLSLRAKYLGYKIIFEPKAVVDHHREQVGGARKSEGRLQWYFDFFSNETYFFLKHRQPLLLPIFLLSKAEWAIRCMFGFGREVSVRSMITPFNGIFNGIKKFRGLQNI